jgi:cell division protein FtsI (penicillin-binding protein 3)
MIIHNEYRQTSSIIFGLFVIIACCITVHIFLIQIYHNSFYTQKAQDQYQTTIIQTPPRALIFDRHGLPIAYNKESTAAFIVPKQLHDEQKVYAFLKKFFPDAYKRLQHARNKSFLYIKRRLTNHDIELINQCDSIDIHLISEPQRFYNNGCLGIVLGMTNIDNQGIIGLEYFYNKQLMGTPADYILEKDARTHHYHFAQTTFNAGNEGIPLYTTIDSQLQSLVYDELQTIMQEFKAKNSCALIMNPDNGDILAMSMYPDFDPNNTQNLDMEKTNNMLTSQTYEPGSVIKTFLILAALAEKVITPDDIIDCENKKETYVNGMRVTTWQAHGRLTISEILELSNNIGTAKIAHKIGEKLYEHYRRCGFGTTPGLNAPGVASGFVNPPRAWSMASLNSLSYGYEIRISMLQLANAFCMIANNGYMVKPRLSLDEPISKDTTPRYNHETVQKLKTILTKTVTQGTAYKTDLPGYTIMGKTGSAVLCINGAYQKGKNLFTFAGIIEKDTYKRVIVTCVKEPERHDLYASSVAVPLFERIAQQMLIHDHQINTEFLVLNKHHSAAH